MLMFALLFVAHRASAFETMTVSIPSTAMHKSFDATIVLPDEYTHGRPDARYPVVYLLHGSGGDNTDWTSNTHIGRLADRYHLIFVMPDGGRESWYIDSPIDPQSRYETYVGEEVVAYVDAHWRTIATKAGRAITGLSMGGFGALSIALDRPGAFGAAGSISGAVDPRSVMNEPGIDDVFGDPTVHAAFWDSKAIVASAPRFRHANIDLTIECGVNDTFVDANRTLHERLVELGVPHDYAERPGGHTWAYWKNAIRYQMLFFATSFRRHGVQRASADQGPGGSPPV
jgi:S-formylglutathione hydrolase FrmB